MEVNFTPHEIFSACGKCKFCLGGLENLCSEFKATGRDANGGYAEYMTVSEKFAYLIPDIFFDVQAAPLLSAGAIGYRSLKLTGLKDGGNLGLTGFGASAHLAIKDVSEFINLAAEMNIKPEVQEYSLTDTNQALVELKNGMIRGAKTIRIN